MRIGVSSSGAIMLDKVVTCDGFVHDYPIRVQTHIHEDHMGDFNSSKGFQHILVTQPTYKLLIAEYNADLPYRTNFEAIPSKQAVPREDCQIRLLDNGHMLGSVQVEVTLSDGKRCGYSGDFTWPLEDVIQVEELVLDSTYGSPDSIRKFSQDEANSRFIELVVEQIRLGPVLISTHRGTLQRAISCLDDAIKIPIIASPRLCNELEVYKEYGYSLAAVLNSDSEEAKVAIREGRYIRLYGNSERRPTDPSEATSVRLKAFKGRLDDPVTMYSEKSFDIALSDHADYLETLEYVHSTGAKKVITDNSKVRGHHASELALALKRELGVDARPSEKQNTREWGT